MTLPRKLKDNLLHRSLSAKERSLDDIANLPGSYRFLRNDSEKLKERRRKRSHTIDFGQMVEVRNMFRIIQVQEKFPHDKLDLSLSLEEFDRKHLHRTVHSSQSLRGSRKGNAPHPELERNNSECKPHEECDKDQGGRASPTPPSLIRRAHVIEGAVKLSSQTSANERYFILFNDLLLVAKPKSQSTFKLKERVRVSEVWISQCIDEITEQICTNDNKSFVIGWPTIPALCNYVAAFSSTEEKELWQSALEKAIADRRKEEELKDITVKVCNRIHEDVGPQQSTLFNVNQKDDARAVIKMALQQFQYQNEDPNDYQLWISNKDTVPYPLIGHELPYAIKSNHTRNMCCQTPDENNNQSMTPDPNLRCQFILKKSKRGGCRHQLDKPPKGWKNKNPMRKSPIIHWAMNKQKSVKSPYTMQNEVLPPGKLFGNPLSQLSTEEETIPKPIQDILVTLFRKGPGTTGIFRKSAAQRTAKQLRQSLDTGKEVEIGEKSAIVLATVLKEFFRSLPESLICSEIFEDLCSTKNQTDTDCRIDEIKRLLHQLPKENYEIIMEFMCVLYHIQRFSDRNNMNSYNLSVCVSPSVMKPPKDSPKTQIEQTSGSSDVVTFIIDNYVNIFSNENEYILGPDSDIHFDDGPGEDSDSGTDQCRERDLSIDDGDDSEKEMEPPAPEILFTPNIDSPFGHSDSSIGTNDSDELKQSFNRINPTSTLVPEINRSKSTPSSPLSVRRDEEMDSGVSYENLRNQSDMSDYDDHNECFQRNLLRQPRPKRVLSNTSTASELIEHKRHMPEAVDYSRKHGCNDVNNKRNGGCYDIITPESEVLDSDINSSNDPKRESALFPKKQIMAQPLVQHFATEFYAAPEIISPAKPNVVFHSVDKRKKPAAPSYEEHIQRTQSKYRAPPPERVVRPERPAQHKRTPQPAPQPVQSEQPIRLAQAIRNPKMNKKPQVHRQSVDNYQPPVQTEQQPVRMAQAIRNPKLNKKPQVHRQSVEDYQPPKPIQQSPAVNSIKPIRDEKTTSKPKPHLSHLPQNFNNFMQNRKNQSPTQNRNGNNGHTANETVHYRNQNSNRNVRNDNLPHRAQHENHQAISKQNQNSIAQLQNEHFENQVRNNELATQMRDDILTTHNRNNNSTNQQQHDNNQKPRFQNINIDRNRKDDLRKQNEIEVLQSKKEKSIVVREADKTKVPRISVTTMSKDNPPESQLNTMHFDVVVSSNISKTDNVESVCTSSPATVTVTTNDVDLNTNLLTEVVPSSQNCKLSREGRKTFRSSTKLRLSPNVSPVRRRNSNQSLPSDIQEDEKVCPNEECPTKKERSLSEPSMDRPKPIELSSQQSCPTRIIYGSQVSDADIEISQTQPTSQSPPKFAGPFSLNVTLNVNKSDSSNVTENPAKFQLDKALLTKATKNDLLPINQLTKRPNQTRDDSAKTVSAKELRRTSRKLKSEFRTFGDGKIVNTPREERRAYDMKMNQGIPTKVLNTKLNGHYNTGKDTIRRGLKVHTDNTDINKENVTNQFNSHSLHLPSTPNENINSHDKLGRSNSNEHRSYTDQISVESVKSNSSDSSAHEAYSTMMSQEESYV